MYWLEIIVSITWKCIEPLVIRTARKYPMRTNTLFLVLWLFYARATKYFLSFMLFYSCYFCRHSAQVTPPLLLFLSLLILHIRVMGSFIVQTDVIKCQFFPALFLLLLLLLLRVRVTILFCRVFPYWIHRCKLS